MRHRVFLVVVLALAILGILAIPFAQAHAATTATPWLSANPLGVNVSPRQSDNAAVNSKIDAQLKALGPVSIRYGGGTLADAYFFDVNRDTYDCAEQWTSNPSLSCSKADTFSLADVMAQAKAIGADVMPIANYGSGTSMLAGSLASTIETDFPAQASSVELGNEPYGCDSIINELELAPLYDTGYQHGSKPDCPYTLYGSVPGIEKMGQSYDTYAPGFIGEVKANDPALKVELPYAISPAGNSGYGWNDTVMPALKGKYSGIVVLWYPEYSAPDMTDAAALNSIRYVPGAAAAIKSDIAKYSPGVTWQIGETNDTNANNVAVCRPAGTVFAAGDALSWLAYGAQNVNWWDETDPINTSTCSKPDFAMFSSTGVAQPPYTGYLLASKLAQPHAVLVPVKTGNSYFLEFHSQLRGGHQDVAYINLSTTATAKLKGYPFPHANLPTYRFSNSHPAIVETHTLTPATVTLPPDSITIFTD